MQTLNIVKAVLSLLPALLEAIKAIEAAMPDQGKGAEKLEMLRQVIGNAYQVAGEAVASFEAVWPALAGAVAGIVGMFNRAGIFKK